METAKFWNWKTRKLTDQNDETEQILFLNGTIAEESWFDDDVTPALFKNELDKHTGDVTVWINSPGGDCVAAAQIYNMLVEHAGDVTVKIDGLAASAASVIAMAGTRVLMSPVSMLMIHNPATVVYGDSTDFDKAKAMLSEVKESIINAYEIKTGLSRVRLSHLMDGETWMNAHKAVELGFADEIIKHDMAGIDPPMVVDSFSQVKVTNSLMEKIAKHCQINTIPPPSSVVEDRTIKADSLMDRLFLIKNWR